LSEVRKRTQAIFSKTVDIRAIELNIEEQIQGLRDFSTMEERPPFYSRERRKRFNIDNDAFSYDDAPILHYMMRRLHPKRIIEIGSGNSSACMLDTSDIYLGDSVDFTFIDLNCDNLRKNLLKTDLRRIQIFEQPIQDVDLTIFATLQANDLLFIDSSHVIKTDSDLCTIFFEVLPILSPGVCIHFHDIRYPFQYQQDMVMKGIFWNEAYLLRAFLMYNKHFVVTFWLNYLLNVDLPEVADLLRFLPLSDWDKRFNNCSNDFSSAGGSIYITKRQ
jgi:predicted O-methyltransferase YrrM